MCALTTCIWTQVRCAAVAVLAAYGWSAVTASRRLAVLAANAVSLRGVALLDTHWLSVRPPSIAGMCFVWCTQKAI